MDRAYQRVVEHNSRATVAHNLFNFASHIGLVAMAGTLGTKVFVVTPATVIKPKKRIIRKVLTFFAKSALFAFVHTVTIDFYHFRQHFFFSGYSVFFHDNLPLKTVYASSAIFVVDFL